MFLLLIATQFSLYSQDSTSLKFLEIYNKYRKEKGLSPLEYSKELETFADERLKVVMKETDHCFPCRDWDNRCPTIDLHFKFSPMAQSNNADSGKKFLVMTENMSVRAEFRETVTRKDENIPKKKRGFFGKISKFFSSIFSSKNEEDVAINYTDVPNDSMYVYKFHRRDTTKTEDIPMIFFEGWKNSDGHRRNFEIPNLTHFAFKTCKAIHNGNEWLHGVWIAGKQK